MTDIKRDSRWSWLVLFCVLCCQVFLGGICLSGGIFYIEFTNVFGEKPVETSWLCSLPITMWFISSPIGSVLTNRYSYRVCSFVGGILAALGLSLSFFTTSLTYLFLTHGFLTGLGLGINFNGCMSALNCYFDKYKTLAAGIASVGHNLGLVIFADLISSLDDHFGLKGMFLLLGGMTFNMCAFAMVMFPVGAESVARRDHFNPGKKKKSSQKKFINFSVFRKLSFVFLCGSNVFVNLSQGIYILHLPSYSRDVGFTQNDFGTVLMVYGISNIIGKVFYSFLGHHPQVNVTIVYTVSLSLTGISMGLTPVFLTRTGMLILAGCVGFFFCVTGALINAIVHSIVGHKRFPDGIGMSMPFKATGNLIGGPLAGALLTTTGSYAFSFFIAGVSMVLASFLMVYPIVHIRQREKSHKAKNLNLVCAKDVNICEKISLNKINKYDIEEQARATQDKPFLSIASKMADLDMSDRIYEEIPCFDGK